jgi:zinc protease
VRRRLNYLSHVLGDRLRVEVREKLGASYSPDAGANANETYPGDGWIVIQAMADPEKADELVEACLKVTDDMAEKGLTADEVERQRKPAQAEVRDRVRTNGYWLQALSRLHTRENAFEDMRTFPTFVDAIQASDLEPLAKEYLKRERASVAIVVPKKKAEPAGSKGAEPTPPKKD